VPKITINVPAEVLEPLRQAAKQNYRTLTAEIVQRCMAPVHTSMANIQQSMADIHTSMAPVHTLKEVLEADGPEESVAVLMSVWKEMFPQVVVTELGMKKLLDIAEGTAEFVFEQIQATASQPNVRNPYGYIQKLLKEAMAKRPKPVISDEDYEWAKRAAMEAGAYDPDDAKWL
jgi:hypothetical protein